MLHYTSLQLLGDLSLVIDGDGYLNLYDVDLNVIRFMLIP